MKKLKIVTVIACFLFWPLSLFLANTPGDFFKYLFPALLVGLSILLFGRTNRVHLFPLLLIPAVEPKFALFPLLVAIAVFILNKQKSSAAFILLSIIVMIITWKSFLGQTIFQPDYEAQQEVVSKSYLYPTVFEARFFQNKPRIYLNKFSNNFFTLIDPNNYFFNFHPREIKIDNQNLNKYPFMSLVFILFGLYHLKNNPHWKFILISLATGVFSLSILKIFDRNDFILWIPITLVIINGIVNFRVKQKYLLKIFYAIFLIFTTTQLIRILINSQQ